MNRFCFIDSSGIIKSDPFFGTGLLIVKNIGDMGDKLNKNSQPAKEKIRLNKNNKIAQMIGQGKVAEVIKMLTNNSRFEMKFDNVRPSTEIFYERMVDIFLSDKDNRFSAMIVNKQNPNFDGNGIEDAWETYTKYAALLVVEEMKNLKGDKLCIVVDEITRPRNKPLSLEDTLLSKIRTEVAKDPTLNFDDVFGAFSIESHSNFLLQVSDLLLGAVMYDYKKKAGSVSGKTESRKEPLVNKLRTTFGINSLAADFKNESFAHFRVFECI